MPESPEIQQMIIELQTTVGSSCNQITINSGRYKKHGPPEGFNEFIKTLPTKLTGIHRKGKLIWFTWENGWVTMIHLGMTGSITSVDNCKKHAHVTFELSRNKYIFFCDQRNFGTLNFQPNDTKLTQELQKLGHDPLADGPISPEYIQEIQKRYPQKTIADVLIDQRFFAGVGNYLRAEIAWKARIHPLRKIGELSGKELEKLRKAIRGVMVVKDREERRYGDVTFWVYGRKEDIDGNAVERIVYRGRSLWVAPRKQSPIGLVS